VSILVLLGRLSRSHYLQRLGMWRCGLGGHPDSYREKEERPICPTTPKLSHVTEGCLKTKLQLFTESRNDTYLLLACVF
jgi:hypothetical protein